MGLQGGLQDFCFGAWCRDITVSEAEFGDWGLGFSEGAEKHRSYCCCLHGFQLHVMGVFHNEYLKRKSRTVQGRAWAEACRV